MRIYMLFRIRLIVLCAFPHLSHRIYIYVLSSRIRLIELMQSCMLSRTHLIESMRIYVFSRIHLIDFSRIYVLSHIRLIELMRI